MHTVFVTGATGVVGSEVVPRLLNDPQTEVRLLIRARDEQHLLQRFQILLDFWEDRFPEPALKRVKLLRGDVALPRFGLESAAYTELAQTVTNVVHAAGNVKLNQSLDDARKTSIGGLKEIIDFCRACQDLGEFNKLDYVSTVGVAGRMPGLIPERRLSEPREFHNTYEQAKAEAEELLWEEMDRDLPATIHRPSMVVGDSTTGEILQFQVFYHLCEFLSGRRTMGILPNLGNAMLDIVPVDYVANLIHRALPRNGTAGQILHLCSGPEHAIRLSHLVSQVRDQFAAHNWPQPKLRQVPSRCLNALLPTMDLLAYRRKWRSLRGLRPLFSYLETCGTQAFDATRTNCFGTSLGLIRSNPEFFLGRVLSWYCAEQQESRNNEAMNPKHASEMVRVK